MSRHIHNIHTATNLLFYSVSILYDVIFFCSCLCCTTLHYDYGPVLGARLPEGFFLSQVGEVFPWHIVWTHSGLNLDK